MRKRFVGLLAFALVLACAAGAWATMPEPMAGGTSLDWTAGSASSDILYGQRVDSFSDGAGLNVSDNITIVLIAKPRGGSNAAGLNSADVFVLSGDSVDYGAPSATAAYSARYDNGFVKISPDGASANSGRATSYISADFALIRTGADAKKRVFSVLFPTQVNVSGLEAQYSASGIGNGLFRAFHGSYSSTDLLVRMQTGTGWSLMSPDLAQVVSLQMFGTYIQALGDNTSTDARVRAGRIYGDSGDFTIEWACAACGQMPCNAPTKSILYFDPASTYRTLYSQGADSVDMVAVRLCDAYQKQWQFMQNDRFPKYEDLVLYSANVSGTHALDLGPYVVDNEIVADATYVWLAAGRRDWVAERLWNKGPFYAFALAGQTDTDGRRYEWNALGELTHYLTTGIAGTAQNNYKVLSYYQRSATNQIIPTYGWSVWPYQYLDKQDATRSGSSLVRPIANEANANRWYRYQVLYRDSADIMPGFSHYYGWGGTTISLDFDYPRTAAGAIDAANIGVTRGMRMDFDATGSTQDFCQRTYLEAKLWSDVAFCFQEPYGHLPAAQWDFATCINLQPKQIDNDMWRELHAKLVADGLIASGTTFSDVMAPYYADATYKDICECGRVETLMQDVTDAFVPTGSSLCLKASFDAYNKATCVGAGRTYFLPAKITFFVSTNQICDAATKAKVDAQVTALTGEQLHKGPIDAFMKSGDVVGDTTLTFGILLPDGETGKDGTWYNLGYLANHRFDTNTRSKDWWGVKNFFRVWPTEATEDGQLNGNPFGGWLAGTVPNRREMSVRESWLNNDKLAISFYVIFVAGDAPAGTDPVQAMDGYFLVYSQAWDKVGVTPAEVDPTRIHTEFGMFSNFTAKSATSTPQPTGTPTSAPTPTSGPTPTSAPTTPTVAPTSGPTTTPTPGSGGSSGGGCNVGFAPAVLLLLAPMALFLRK